MNESDNLIETHTTDGVLVQEYRCNTLVVGSGCAAFNAADSLYDEGVQDVLMVTEGINMGTSRNTGSDKQTYYKLSLAGSTQDSIYDMAQALYDGQSVDGDTALVEAALSTRCFYKLIQKGVPFPQDIYGQYVGYKTDHDKMQRGTSCGPLTSRYMTEHLETSVNSKEIAILDQIRIIRLLTKEDDDKQDEDGRTVVCGVIGIVKNAGELTFARIQCTNLVYATGGPSGIYYNSVYPKSQTCAHGAAIQAGAKLNNVTEWQYGIASVDFRWNLSGSYQQVIPRYISANEDGSDEREFLMDYFDSPGDMLTAVFFKGYQWPFDPRKVGKGGSSLIDFAVYQENVIHGRKVFLDFTENPLAASAKDGSFDFSLLGPEAYDYLEKSEILFGTPVERLKKMNLPAYELYRAHQIDLEKDRLRISVCAQHNNGGLAVNRWWESNLGHFFPVGEVCGNFGVYRPGGSALNATQVGSLRAAQYIASRYNREPKDARDFQHQTKKDLSMLISMSRELMQKNEQKRNPLRMREDFQKKMDVCASFIRDGGMVKEYLPICQSHLEHFTEETYAVSPQDITDAWINRDILITQYVYLQAMLTYEKEGGESRGSYMIRNDHMTDSSVKDLGLKVDLDEGRRKDIIQVCQLINGIVTVNNRKRHLIPKEDLWFEEIYKAYHEDKIIGK